MSNTHRKNQRVNDKVLTSVVMGYDVNQEFTAHHLFPEVGVNSYSGKLIVFGKADHVIHDTVRAPGETVKSVGISYGKDDYTLENRYLEGKVPEEDVEDMKEAGLSDKVEAVNHVTRIMLLEKEHYAVNLATTAGNYATGHSLGLTGSDMFDNPVCNAKAIIDDAKNTVRAKIGRDPNVLHLDHYARRGLEQNEKLLAWIDKTRQSTTLDEALFAKYFDVEKVIFAKAVYLDDIDSDFTELWGNNTVLAYVPPQKLRSKRVMSFGYTYARKGFPVAKKGYYSESDLSYHYPVHMQDKAHITCANAGFLLQNTASMT